MRDEFRNSAIELFCPWILWLSNMGSGRFSPGRHDGEAELPQADAFRSNGKSIRFMIAGFSRQCRKNSIIEEPRPNLQPLAVSDLRFL